MQKYDLAIRVDHRQEEAILAFLIMMS